MSNTIHTEKRKLSFWDKLSHPEQQYRAYIILDNNEEASFYGKTEKEAREKAEHYREHYLS